MPLQPHHPRRRSRAGNPLRRFCDFEPGDTFRYYGKEFMKCLDGSACPTDPVPAPFSVVTLPSGKWLLDF